MMKMATEDDSPLRQGAGTGLDWFSVATEASGGGTPDLGYVLEVSVYITDFGVENKSGGPRGSHEVGGAPRGVGRAPTLVVALGLFWPISGTPWASSGPKMIAKVLFRLDSV